MSPTWTSYCYILHNTVRSINYMANWLLLLVTAHLGLDSGVGTGLTHSHRVKIGKGFVFVNEYSSTYPSQDL